MLAAENRLTAVREFAARPARFGQLKTLDGDMAAYESSQPKAASKALLANLTETRHAPGARGSLQPKQLYRDLLNTAGITQLYSHQAEAIDAIRMGESCVITTSTASGKSLCYQLPIAERTHLTKGRAKALMVFPTKALAHDQLRSICKFDAFSLRAHTFDGDASAAQRRAAMSEANVLLTNPEMLHQSLLPNVQRWKRFLSDLEFVVIDELHVLRGVFGSHIGHILRRLRRLCERFGADPTFVFTSATIGEAASLASELCAKPVRLIENDGSGCGPRTVALVNPPLLDDVSSARLPATTETARIVAELVKMEVSTIAFAQSRRRCELIAAETAGLLPQELSQSVRAYRGGYLAHERREIEHELATGELSAVIATSALELGVDIGALDACVLCGFPGTIASFWQQAGRAGRSLDASLVVLVADVDQLDQWLINHPNELFERPAEPVVVNLLNPFIYEPHLGCASFESPLKHQDAKYWPEVLDEAVSSLVEADLCVARVIKDEPAVMWAHSGSPSRGVGLRSGSSREFLIKDSNGELVGTIDEARAYTQTHLGAIYMHRGKHFRVLDLNERFGEVTVESADGSEYTQTNSVSSIELIGVDEHYELGQLTVALGSVEVSEKVTGYQRKSRRARKVIESVPLDSPEQKLATRAVFYTMDIPVLSDLGGALHAAEHALIGMLPLFTICDRWDVGGISIELHPDTGCPSIFIFDAYPGGTGIAELAYSIAAEHCLATIESISSCSCSYGCLSCVVSPKCGNGNEPLDKAGAIEILGLAHQPGQH